MPSKGFKVSDGSCGAWTLCFSGSITEKHMNLRKEDKLQEATTRVVADCLAPARCCRSGADTRDESNTDVAHAWHHACMPSMCHQSKAALQGLLADYTPLSDV